MIVGQFDISHDLFVEICKAISQGKRVLAVKIVRDATRDQQIRPTLGTCKKMVDLICDGNWTSFNIHRPDNTEEVFHRVG